MSKGEWTPARIKDLRQRLGKNQREFAEMADVHVVTLIRWEKGTFSPSHMAMKVLDILDEQAK